MLKRVWQKVRSLDLREILSRDDENRVELLEERLITADFSMDLTMRIVERVTAEAKGNGRAIEKALFDEIVSVLTLEENDYSLHDPSAVEGPSVILLVGSNGTGKTTTCAKLARKYMGDGYEVLLVAADTFRAGASEQLRKWSERVGCDVLTQKMGADPASVLYDGIQTAHTRGIDVVLCDTAGRLHTESMLMEELKKIHRVTKKLVPSAPHEVLLVLDATIGQNAVRQAKTFHRSLGITGIVLCKMDGTSKGGVVVSITDRFGLPVKLLGVGECSDDLLPFEPSSFASRLLGRTETPISNHPTDSSPS